MSQNPVTVTALKVGDLIDVASRRREQPWLLIVATGLLLLAGKQPGGASPGSAARLSCVDQPIFEANFSTGDLDRCMWIALRENWGGKLDAEDYNGGVVPENVSVGGGVVHLRALGNNYGGDVRGIGSDKRARPHGRRTGAAISTRQHFLGGRFEARVRIIPKLGVCSAMWTFFLDDQHGKPVRNHEIDIEFPGREHINAPPSLQYVALTTWTGLLPGESSTAFRALSASWEEFQILRFDWQPPTILSMGYVRFYINETLVHQTLDNIPSEPAPLLLGVWFPKSWAGDPDFDQEEMLVDWVRIAPLK